MRIRRRRCGKHRDVPTSNGFIAEVSRFTPVRIKGRFSEPNRSTLTTRPVTGDPRFRLTNGRRLSRSDSQHFRERLRPFRHLPGRGGRGEGMERLTFYDPIVRRRWQKSVN